MIRCCALFALFAGIAAVVGGCTLLLPTAELIKPCVEQADCDDGFICQDEACLPEDEGVAGESG